MDIRTLRYLYGPQIQRWCARVGVGVVLVGGCFALLQWKLPLCGVWFRPACPGACPGLDAAVSARSNGQYDESLRLMDVALTDRRDSSCWHDFQAQYDQKLGVGFQYEYRPNGRGAALTGPVGQIRFSTEDPYWFFVNLSERGYLYLFQLDAAGNLTVVFPNRESSKIGNPIAPGEQRFPDLNHQLHVGKKSGHERLFLISTRWEIPDFERLARDAASAKESRRREFGDRFLARVAAERSFAGHRPGHRFAEIDIESLGAPGAQGASKEQNHEISQTPVLLRVGADR